LIPIVLVVAVAENGIIGNAGGLPWRMKADLRRFRALTLGKPVIMGRKTFESIGRALDGRDNIVVTGQPDYAAEGVIVVHGLTDALQVAEARAAVSGASEIAVIGGGEIFTETLPLASRLHVTHIEGEVPGDTRFPPISADEWSGTEPELLAAAEGDTVSGRYVLYERRP
jgi:dihydrofolate reductase